MGPALDPVRRYAGRETGSSPYGAPARRIKTRNWTGRPVGVLQCTRPNGRLMASPDCSAKPERESVRISRVADFDAIGQVDDFFGVPVFISDFLHLDSEKEPDDVVQAGRNWSAAPKMSSNCSPVMMGRSHNGLEPSHRKLAKPTKSTCELPLVVDPSRAGVIVASPKYE